MSSVGRQVHLGIVRQLYQKFLEQTLMLMVIKVNKSRKNNKSVKLFSTMNWYNAVYYCILYNIIILQYGTAVLKVKA